MIGGAWGPERGKESGETALFRQLFAPLRPADLIVADRYDCSYWVIAFLREVGVDMVFRLHQLRHRRDDLGRRATLPLPAAIKLCRGGANRGSVSFGCG